ncbi:hypothetical protein [Chryseobacterium sp. Mn2064]|uniref:hypothetical protein n=1 Tax=Chryseobacterium sp. Mn2064 TaxID=3395263 RepID=UPI003BCCF514
MIKFNFNANVNIQNKRSSIDKKGIKIILIVFGVFIFICVASVIGVTSFITGTITSMEKQSEEHSRQREYVLSLPVLKCVIHSDKTISAPLSGQKAALCLLSFGKAKIYSKNSYRIYENFDYSMAADYPEGTKLSVNGKLYDIDFKMCIMDSLGDGKYHLTKGIYGKTYKASYLLNNYKPVENEKVATLKGKHPLVNSFGESSGPNNILVNEYVFKNGDSLYIKGKIEGNRIVPFVEHVIFY